MARVANALPFGSPFTSPPPPRLSQSNSGQDAFGSHPEARSPDPRRRGRVAVPHAGCHDDEIFSPIRWEGGELLLLDQTVLPAREEWLHCRRPEDVAAAIRRLAVRGAPAIGVAAAFGLVLAIDPDERDGDDADASGCGRGAGCCSRPDPPPSTCAGRSIGAPRWRRSRARKARAPWSCGRPCSSGRSACAERDIEANLRLGEHGKTLFATGSRVLTHCNTGSLATAGYGTALGVIQSAWIDGRVSSVWVDETRPLLQGRG